MQFHGAPCNTSLVSSTKCRIWEDPKPQVVVPRVQVRLEPASDPCQDHDRQFQGVCQSILPWVNGQTVQTVNALRILRMVDCWLAKQLMSLAEPGAYYGMIYMESLPPPPTGSVFYTYSGVVGGVTACQTYF